MNNQKEAGHGAEGGCTGGGEAEELTHSSVGAFVAQRGTESSGALLNISSIWCHYRPSDHHRHHQRRPRDSALQAGEG